MKLKAYNPCYLDEFILWTESRDVGSGFRCIHMLCNTSLNFNASKVYEVQDTRMLYNASLNFNASKVDGLQDGNKLTLSYWILGDNPHLQWKIVPWCKSSYSTHLALP